MGQAVEHRIHGWRAQAQVHDDGQSLALGLGEDGVMPGIVHGAVPLQAAGQDADRAAQLAHAADLLDRDVRLAVWHDGIEKMRPPDSAQARAMKVL